MFGKLTLPSAQELDLTRSNFDFVGWNLYDEQNWAMYLAETPYSVGLTGEPDGVVVLHAAWAEKPIYTISYDANGGAGAPAMAQAHEGETICLGATVPARGNYTFLGWATSASAQEADLWFAEKMLGSGARARICATVNPSFDIEYFREKDFISGDDAELAEKCAAAYEKMGFVMNLTCTPYFDGNLPRLGENTAFSASSATARPSAATSTCSRTSCPWTCPACTWCWTAPTAPPAPSRPCSSGSWAPRLRPCTPSRTA